MWRGAKRSTPAWHEVHMSEQARIIVIGDIMGCSTLDHLAPAYDPKGGRMHPPAVGGWREDAGPLTPTLSPRGGEGAERLSA